MTEQKKTNSLNDQDLRELLLFTVTGQTTDDKALKRIKRMAKGAATRTDVVRIVKGMTSHYDQLITQLMDIVQVQDRVITKLGGTPEMKKEAETELNEVIAAKRKELEEAQEQLKAAKETTETEAE